MLGFGALRARHAKEAAAAERTGPLHVAAPGRVLGVAALGYLLGSWAMNPVSSILPTISTDLAIDVTQAGFLMNAYFAVLVAWVLVAGRFGDAFGHGLVFRVGCLLFAVGSFLAAVSPGYKLLLAGRAFQGLGSALVFGTTLAIVATAYPGPRLAWAVGILTVANGATGIVGVWLSVQLAQLANWHWSFVVPGLLGMAAVIMGRDVPSVKRVQARDVDWLGGALLCGALSLFLLGLNHLHEGPETFESGAPYHLSMHLAALGLFVAFVWRQSRAARPLIQLHLLRNARLSCGVIANGIAHSSMLATSLLIPFLLERGRSGTPNETAQLVLSMQVTLIAGSYAGGWLYQRRGTPLIGIAALAAIASGLLTLGRIGPDLPYPALFPLTMLLGAGLGVFTTVNNTAIMAAVAPDQRGFAGGLVETTRQLGHSVGVSISSTILASSLATATVATMGYRDGFTEAASTMGLVSAAGAALVLYPLLNRRLRTRQAATA